ncbi:hypothetical protein BGZ52_009968, partial [Haplosporangium bisporale]
REVLMEGLDDPVGNGLLKKRSKWNPFSGSKRKKEMEELKMQQEYFSPKVKNIRVIMSMCDLKQGTTNPCGFPGLIPTVTYSDREPIHCYNQTRDILLEVLTYLGTAGPSSVTKTMVSSTTGNVMTVPIPGEFAKGARLQNLDQERARLVEFRKKRFLEHAGTFAGPVGDPSAISPSLVRDGRLQLSQYIAICKARMPFNNALNTAPERMMTSSTSTSVV